MYRPSLDRNIAKKTKVNFQIWASPNSPNGKYATASCSLSPEANDLEVMENETTSLNLFSNWTKYDPWSLG